MNKYISALLLLLFCPSFVLGQPADVELRVGAFVPSSSHFIDIYDEVLPFYQLHATVPLTSFIEGWGAFDYVYGSGRAKPCHASTNINLYTWNFGPIGTFSTEFGDYYLGIGPSLCLINIRNSACGYESTSKLSVGGIVKAGMLYNFSSQYYADIFTDYTYQPAHMDRHVNVGGLRAGVGLGYAF